MPTIHVHVKGKQYTYAPRTRDAGSLRTMYADLEERMMLALRYTLTHARTGDDLAAGNQEGHQFYGNQHTGGIGGPHKPKHTHIGQVQMDLAHKKIKSAKMAVHALLSSGHAFSKEELAIAVGMDPQGKTINDYLTNLKNPKFAGPQGALKIEKNMHGHFYVAMPNGAPAPPPDTKLDLSKPVKEPGADPLEHLYSPEYLADVETPKPPPVVHAPPAPPPVPEALKPFEVWQKHLEVMKGQPPGSMSSTQADTSYTAAMNAAFDDLQENIKKGVGAHSAMLDWKEMRAEAMAAWAQAVHGTPYKTPTAPQVFKADLQLYEDVKAGKSQLDALSDWKKNTNAEKKGLFPPGAVPVAKPIVKPAATPAPVHTPVHAVHSALPAAVPVAPIDYDSLVPASHKPIGSDDILKGKYADGAQTLHNAMYAAGSNAVTNKTNIENDLRTRLADKPNFQALVKRMGLAKSGVGSAEAKLVQAWANNSGDHRDLSCALQMAVKDAFNIPDSAVYLGSLHQVAAHGNTDALSVAGANTLRSSSVPAFTKADAPTIRAAFQEFAQAQYHATQEWLAKEGVDHLYLARGMKMKANPTLNETGPSSLKLQPASSFSTSYSTARDGFAGGSGTVFLTKVPRQQVLGSFLTGYGCTDEHEVVVLGHEKLKTYIVPYYDASSHTQAQSFVKSHIIAGAKS